MNSKIMRPIHAGVHHKNTGFNGGALTGFEDHRTDGQRRRSTTLHDFNKGVISDSQWLITYIGQLKRKSQVGI